ncbi:MAG: hypothetical protein EP300_01225 [Gammaproteobacteria bacterium]|nr:MAG: hypothetical protein EP300_01225 [Gammaproteobacteria bacterium]
MSVESSIQDTTDSIVSALSTHDLSEAEIAEIHAAVSKLLVKTVEKTTKNAAKTAASCCGPELDLAHQIQEEIRRRQDLLISNLKALR